MKKFPLFLIFSILCIQLSYSNSISKDKKKTSEVPYLNSAMGTSRFHRITDYLILNAIPFSFDYTSLANKSAQAEDSIPTSKTEYEFGTKDIYTTSYDWENGIWVPDSRGDFYFSFSSTLSDSSVYHNYDTIAQDWVLDTKWISTFNESEQRTEQIMYEYQHEASIWKKSIKQTLDYLNNGDSIVEEQFYWPEIDTNWTQIIKYATTYENGLRKRYYLYNWDMLTSQYKMQSKEEYFYDESDNLIKSVSSFWDEASSNFVEIMKLIYSGDDLEYVTFFTWMSETQTWTPNGLMIYNLDKNGRSTSTDYFDYNESGDNFIKNEATVFLYKDQVVGINNLPKMEVQIYPNPTKDMLILKHDNLGKYAFEIIDINGKVLLSKQSTNPQNKISLKDFERGMYILKLRSGGQVLTKQIIKK